MANIVLIEDDQTLRKIVYKLLEKNGHSVTDSGDGKEGLELTRHLHPDLLISDLLLPNMHGMDVCRNIREDSKYDGTKIILMTGLYKTQRYQMEARKYGISDYIYKPFNNDEFIEKVNKALGASDVMDEKELVIEDLNEKPSAKPPEKKPVKPEKEIQKKKSEKEEKTFDVEVLKKLDRRITVMDNCWKLYSTQSNNKTFLSQLVKLADFSEFSRIIPSDKELLDKAKLFEVGIDELNRTFPKCSEKLNQKVDVLFHKLKEFALNIIMTSEHSMMQLESNKDLKEIEPNRLIYIVDDQTGHSELLKKTLDKSGYVTSLFSDLYDLMTCVSDNPPAVIIMDLGFIDRDYGNVELIKHICKPELLSIPLFYMSENTDYQSRLKAVASSGTLFLSKPIIEEDLIGHLDAFIHKPILEPYRVLLIEKKDHIAQSLMFLLTAAGLETRIIRKEEDSIKLFDEFDPDLIVLGSREDEEASLRYAKVVRQLHNCFDIPIIFLKEDEDQSHCEASNGVDGYISLNASPTVLLSSINFRAKRFRDLKEMVSRDRMTGLLNHLSLKEQLSIILSRCKRLKTKTTFALLEIDDDMELKEKFGVAAFENVIRSYSVALRNNLRKTDVVGWYGRGRFALIFPDTEMEHAKSVILKLQHKLSKIHFGKGKNVHKVTCSCGMAEFPMFSSPSILAFSAEKVLVKAQEKGKGSIVNAFTQT